MSFKELKEVRLIDICELISRVVSPAYTENKNEGILVINQKCIRDNTINLELARLTNPNKKKITETKYVKKYDILVNSTGVGTLGRVAQVKNINSKITVDSHVTIVRPKKEINPVFLGYNLFMNQRWIEHLAEGSTGQTELSKIRLGKSIKIKLPPLEEQKAIANILSTLDEKIETNNEINKKLEEMAQAIFKQWFVDFEFPNEEGKPYKSSGGEMIESEMGMIPKGWEVGKIGEYVSIKSGYAFKSTWWAQNGIPVIKIKNIQNNTINFNDISYVSEEKIQYANDFIVKDGDLLIAMTGATIGKFAIVPKNKSTILVNQRVGKFYLGDKPLEKLPFIYCTLKRNEIVTKIVSVGHGSAQANISSKSIENIDIVLPSQKYLLELNNILQPLFKKIVDNIYLNTQLIELRDTLLPKLMSGEVRVPLDNN